MKFLIRIRTKIMLARQKLEDFTEKDRPAISHPARLVTPGVNKESWV